MGRSHESWSKREKEKKKQKRKEDKLKKKEARKEDGGSKSFDDMIAYVDEFGNIVDTPPEEQNREEINAEDIVLGIPPKEESDEINEGTVKFFDDSKGYGFIAVKGTGESLFTHIKSHIDEIQEGNRVTFDIAPGDKGPVAINVKILK
jgi:cold shock CspA family protein